MGYAKKFIESAGKITVKDFLASDDYKKKFPWLLEKAEKMHADNKDDELLYGKGTNDHKATVVGDTVGDPFKDTSGPSLNILIKLMSVVSVVFAGVVVYYGPQIARFLGIE